MAHSRTDADVRPFSHRLVMVEGIMGSGKSATMRLIAKHLEENGHQALPVHERNDPHPVRATDELEHWFEPWRDATPAQLAQRALAKWGVFAESIRKGDAIAVMDGQLFHGDLTNLFLMEAEPALIADYVQKLVTVIEPLNPFVIYFRQEDVDRAIRMVCAERGDEWVKYQIDWKLKGPYSIGRGFANLEGLIALYRDYREMTDQLFAQLPLHKLAIENSSRDWTLYEQHILNALQLPIYR